MEIDAQTLEELAVNAEMDHWFLHSGVGTDLEKVRFLAGHLREAAIYIQDLKSENAILEDQLDAAGEA